MRMITTMTVKTTNKKANANKKAATFVCKKLNSIDNH